MTSFLNEHTHGAGRLFQDQKRETFFDRIRRYLRRFLNVNTFRQG